MCLSKIRTIHFKILIFSFCTILWIFIVCLFACSNLFWIWEILSNFLLRIMGQFLNTESKILKSKISESTIYIFVLFIVFFFLSKVLRTNFWFFFFNLFFISEQHQAVLKVMHGSEFSNLSQVITSGGILHQALCTAYQQY